MTSAEAVKTKWGIDTTHSEVQFKVKHLVIATVTGSFKKFSGSVDAENENDFDGAKVEFKIDVDSIDTNQKDRDAHLKSPDFFSTEEYPTISFKGELKKVDESTYTLTGPLTIRGTSKVIHLDVEYGGTIKDPWGNTRAGFELNGKVNRKDFGLSWSALTETGGVVVADDVKLHLNIEVVKA
jgi:polyisoprenoid-binding protein YceI